MIEEHTSDAKARRFISPPDIDLETPGTPMRVFATFCRPNCNLNDIH